MSSLFYRDRVVTVFIGRLACVLSMEGRFLALGGINSTDDRIGSGGNRKDVAFLVTADGRWLIGSKPKQMLVSEKKRRRRLRLLKRK